MGNRVLITCPPMIGSIDAVRYRFEEKNVETYMPSFQQTLSVPELIALVPDFDGWIIGDDPATKDVFAAGKRGKLRAAVKWGVGIDNVDRKGAAELGFKVVNTPGMFGTDVADIALGYVIALARRTFAIDRGVRNGQWPKPVGVSLAGKSAAIVGFGDIGRQLAKRLAACDVEVVVYDPYVPVTQVRPHKLLPWPSGIGSVDFIILTCSLNESTRNIICSQSLALLKQGVLLVNVSRGGLISEADLATALQSQIVGGAALEVFETEPLPSGSALRNIENVILGSHNASNTREAVIRTSRKAIDFLFEMLGS
jgi:D-3-phosphoglycerate dehydrogenase / 2-oxoglutarate reductase